MIIRVDDHPLVREALVMLIEEEQDLEVCGMAETASEALDAIPEVNPDLVLADLSLPEMSGIGLIERLLVLKPLLLFFLHIQNLFMQSRRLRRVRRAIPEGRPAGHEAGIRHVLGGKVYASGRYASGRCAAEGSSVQAGALAKQDAGRAS